MVSVKLSCPSETRFLTCEVLDLRDEVEELTLTHWVLSVGQTSGQRLSGQSSSVSGVVMNTITKSDVGRKEFVSASMDQPSPEESQGRNSRQEPGGRN